MACLRWSLGKHDRTRSTSRASWDVYPLTRLAQVPPLSGRSSYAADRIRSGCDTPNARLFAGDYFARDGVRLWEHWLHSRSQGPRRGWCASADSKDTWASLSYQLIIDKTTAQRAALENLSKVLQAAGSGLEHVVKANIFLTDMANFAPMNEVYAQVLSLFPPVRTRPLSTPAGAVLRERRHACAGGSLIRRYPTEYADVLALWTARPVSPSRHSR